MSPVDPIIKDWLEAGALLATLLGIPIAIVVFWFERRRERLTREEDVYLRPNLQYIEYLKLCLEYPELDIYDLVTPTEPTPLNKKREWIAFTILASVMEQAFLLYRNHPKQDNKQWKGWCDYMRWWMARPNFREAWHKNLSDQFDTDFIEFVNTLPPYDLAPDDFSIDWMTQGSRGVSAQQVPTD